jgi:cystathionine beta-synthase
MKYYNNVIELIGNTPLVKLNNITKGFKAQVFAKVEYQNPGGSIKDRIGISMIERAEKDGSLKPGGTIIEATSGNTGIGLALCAAVKGYKCIFVMTSKVAEEKRNYLKALGAEVIIQPMTAKPNDPENYVNVAKRLATEIPNSVFMYQYSNPGNNEAHYNTTGPEIWRDTDGKITHFVSGVGTTGTIVGAGKYLKEQNPNVKVIGSDPYGSIYKTYKETGDIPESIPYLVEGVGQECLPAIADFQWIDEIYNVSDRDSIDMCRRLGREEGLFVGGSTGTIAYTAIKLASELDENAIVVFIVCDTGERYLTKYHNEKWLREKKLLNPDELNVGDIYDTKKTDGVPQLVSVNSGNKVYEALELMNQYNISNVPVIDGDNCVGSLNETDIISKVMNDSSVGGKEVKAVMGEKLTSLETTDEFRKALDILKDKHAVLVSEHGCPVGILSRYDVLDFTGY